jgi:hypothetical protein
MNRPGRLFALIVIAIATAACSAANPAAPLTANPTLGPSLTPAPTATATPSPTDTPSSAEPTPDPAVLTADGIGSYVVGATLSDLQSRGLVANVASSVNCDASWQDAQATGRYAEQLTVNFHLGRVTDVATSSTELVTPSGARVGMSLTELQAIYGSSGTLIKGINGNQALSVRVPNTTLGIVFYLDETNTKAVSMSAGEVERLEQAAEFGEGC